MKSAFYLPQKEKMKAARRIRRRLKIKMGDRPARMIFHFK